MSFEEPPEAGPSRLQYRRPSNSQAITSPRASEATCPLGSQCRVENTTSGRNSYTRQRASEHDGGKRQEPSASFDSSSSSSFAASASSTSDSSSGEFVGPSASPISSNASVTLTGSSSFIVASISGSDSTFSTSTSTFSAPWTYSPTRSSASISASSTAYVPGVLLNLTLSGDSESQAVYAVEMDFGHTESPTKRASSDSQGGRRRRKRDGNVSGDETDQVMALQVDLGSSDMWVASATCSTSSCKSAPALYNTTLSIDSGSEANITYQSGAIAGEIYWEEVELGGFGIGYQAFIAADAVTDEDLSGGQYSGVLGLALPANSVILQQIPGTTSSDPDGATFLDNLFGSGVSAPSQRLFSLSLERREDVRTISQLGIGAVSSSLCPTPCSPTYLPIIAQPSLGATGYLHWRISLQGVSATTWSDAQHGTGATRANITLGGSQVVQMSSPVAVLDSGGVAVLVGYKPYTDALYAAYGISASSDGYYRMPCTTQLAFSFNFAGQDFPAHPLDMSWPDPDDSTQATCIGAIQYSSTLGDAGDFIMGSAFLKNVYSIFQYPDTTKGTTWQPTVGMISLTNASVASTDFYAVRTLHQSLSTVSSRSGGSTSGGTSSPSSQVTSGSGSAGHAVASTTIIIACSVVGFFVFAAAAFCAWWFWLRRKFGAAGVVQYKNASDRPGGPGHKSELSGSTLRSRKHTDVQRQKSMIEGYSDFEGDSWLSTTEGADSIRLGYLPEVIEEDEGRTSRPVERNSADFSVRTSSNGQTPTAALLDLSDGERSPRAILNPLRRESDVSVPRRDASPANRTVSFLAMTAEPGGMSPTRYSETHDLLMDSPTSISPPSPYAYPSTLPAPGAGRGMSMSMSGPFPSPMRSSMRPDSSPMYDIRASDYFTVTSASNEMSGRGRNSRRDLSSDGSREVRRGRDRSEVEDGTGLGETR